MNRAIFVDFDGTITDVDTFDLLVRSAAGDAAWDELEALLAARSITLREALRRQAALVRYTLPQTLALLGTRARVDPTFASFVRAARANGAQVSVVSAGLGAVIAAALEGAGIALPIYANEVDFDPNGWRMSFIDDSIHGHDKAARVRAARADGAQTVYVGDGVSDFAGAAEADLRFTKRGRALERYCRDAGLRYTAFARFDEIERALFDAPA